MADARLLQHDEILKLRSATVSAGLTGSRDGLLAGIDAAFVAGLSGEGAPGTRILNDLDALNAAGALEDGTVPLTLWLRNAVALAGPRREAEVFRRAAELLGEAGTVPKPQGSASSKRADGGKATSQFSVNISNSNVGSVAIGDGARSEGHVSQGPPGFSTASGGYQGPAAAPHGSGSAQRGAEGPIDFAILTAIEVERRAVCAAFGLGDDHRVRKDSRVYWRGRLPLKNGGAYELVVAQSPDMANVDAALLTSDMLHHWSPGAALMVGIAASTKPGEVKLGDVVAGSDVYYYERGKVTPSGTKPEPKMVPADATLWSNVTTLPKWSDKLPVKRPDKSKARPKLHFGVIASGEKVLADEAARDRIAAGHRKILAVEMEGYGFSRAVWQSFERVRHLVIRGICDDGSPAKDDRWHGYAASSAAGLAKHFLLDRPLEPRARSHPARP